MIELLAGDCLVILDNMAENSIDAVVTDPPYELGFMGKSWDASGVAFCQKTWAKVLRVMKPGAHLVAFGAPKNYHRLACAIEDAGFEIRDSLMWVFGSGFPKSLDVSKAIDKAAGAEAREWQGWGTSLKPAYEPIVLARKPLSEGTVAANVLKWGTGALNIDATRVQAGSDYSNLRVTQGGDHFSIGSGAKTRGTTFKPASGRWPANLAHDGSEEVVALFPESKGQQGDVRGTEPSHTGDENANCYGDYGRVHFAKRSDFGSAARFFYCSKASKADRAGSKHPTVKPVALMRWLVRMVTPPGGTVLDPFAGSGTTGQAAMQEGFDAVLIEREPEYQQDIRRRLQMATTLFEAAE